MTNFDKCVDLVAVDMAADIEEFRRRGYAITDWTSMLDAFGEDSADVKDDIRYVLVRAANDGTIPMCFSDDLSIEDGGESKTYRQLTNAIRRRLFA